MNIRWLVVVVALATTTSLASPVNGTAEQISRAVLQMPDTLKARMLAALARGDLSGAISLWQLETGRDAPKWLLAFQSAFSADNQKAGPCIQVARSIFDGFQRLGKTPTYVRFTATGTRWGDDFIAFELRAGDPRSTIQISNNATHYAVQIGDRIYDAMTEPTGLVMTEYMKRLFSPGSLSMQTVSQLP
ncbi:hypothetical protein [Vitiosangium sp. GDMCC 1.1324]|uniref:hypothetical protein n=1 Tax=Vitiosangium sp. (strain GDMCC 1.1324) TaxID=2138576 RepID=UPI000D37952F|nr:hypothetical protein [Vitiosangium sp. GDMCC 1.1324]PTL85544.1 hypothetical protein DAT35_02170 [Vitiosangium sp. GDMCC 1.1324]